MEELKEIYKKALKEKEEILVKVKPLKAKEEEIMKKIAPIEAELVAVREEIVKVEGTKLAEVSRTISLLAPRGKRILMEPGKIGIKT